MASYLLYNLQCKHSDGASLRIMLPLCNFSRIIHKAMSATRWGGLWQARPPTLKQNSWTPLPLKMGPIGCPETSGQNYHSKPRNIPEERRSHLRRGGSLKSRKIKETERRRKYNMFILMRKNKFKEIYYYMLNTWACNLITNLHISLTYCIFLVFVIQCSLTTNKIHLIM